MSLVNAPDLETENLILRGPEKRDIEPMIAFLMDQERAAGFGPSPDRGDAWRWFALSVGHWHIHGYGYFTIEEKASGKPAGICGIWNPDDAAADLGQGARYLISDDRPTGVEADRPRS